jgi:hypothetical protein
VLGADYIGLGGDVSSGSKFIISLFRQRLYGLCSSSCLKKPPSFSFMLLQTKEGEGKWTKRTRT